MRCWRVCLTAECSQRPILLGTECSVTVVQSVQILLSGIHISSNKKLVAEQDAATIQALRFQILAESTSDLVGFSDLRGNITYLNPAGRKLLNLHGTSWQGMSIDELSTPHYREKIRKKASPRAMATIVRDMRPYRQLEVQSPKLSVSQVVRLPV